jgi:DNA-binding SARP family transcriptional activator
MIQLKTLGALGLKGSDGRDVLPILAQPKRFALLAYLALAKSDGFHRRDTVVALFWPELDQIRARNALRQAVWFLRRSLGDRVVIGRGEEELGVDRTQLSCDAIQFEQACVGGSTSEALGMYQGEFLEGLFVSDCGPELEQWVAEERSRLRRLASEAASARAEQDRADGDHAAAIRWARWAAALLPDDERAIRRLIVLLDQVGDRAGALHAYDELAQRLTREFGVPPSPDSQALVHTIRARVADPPGSTDSVGVLHVSERPKLVEPFDASLRLTQTPPGRWSRGRVAVLGATLGLASAAAVAWWPGDNAPVDGKVVAVAPFRVVSADSSLGYLREGITELLAAELTGEGGPRALDPRAVLHAWAQLAGPAAPDPPPRAALGMAQRLGAGRLVQGGVVGDRQHLILTASIMNVPAGREAGRARVEGPADSIAPLVDRLTAQLLTGEAHEPEPRLASLTSLPSLRAYLDARAALRVGKSREALRHFDRALELDSTFALAGIGVLSAAQWVPGSGDDAGRGARLAWAAQDRLSQEDRAILTAWTGPHYPSPSTTADFLAARQAAVGLAPDRAEAWYLLGDLYFHAGAQLGLDRPRERAAAAFRRALVLDSLSGVDSAYPESLPHLFDLALDQGDLAAARQWLAIVLADSAREGADAYRWRFAVAAADSAGLEALRRRFEQMDEQSLLRIMGDAQSHGVALADGERAAEVLGRRVGTAQQDNNVLFGAHRLALNLGRPALALAVIDRMPDPMFIPHMSLYFRILDRLFGGGDSAAADRAAAQLAAFAAQPMPRDSAARAARATDLCVLGLWWTAVRSWERAERALSELETVGPGGAWFFTAGDQALCRGMIGGWLAHARGQPDARALAQRLDSLLLTGPPTVWLSEATLVDARLLESAGDMARALRVIRRLTRPPGTLDYLPEFLQEDGRLAVLTGDTTGAIQAYRHYLALRWAPEPVVRPGVEAVRAELARLRRGLAMDATPQSR